MTVTETWQLATEKKVLVATFGYHRKADKTSNYIQWQLWQLKIIAK